MNKYSSYKKSDTKWIEDIPSDWEKFRLRVLGNLYGGLTSKKKDDFNNELNTSNKPFITFKNISENIYISDQDFEYVNVEEGENQNKVIKNDLFFLMSSESFEDLGKCSVILDNIDELYLNSFCKGYRLTNSNVYPPFLNYQLNGSLHKQFIGVEGNGFTRINLRKEKLQDIPVFIPPLEEQKKIVLYLDKKIPLIDSLIYKNEKKIEHQKEEIQTYINNVVIDKSIKKERLEYVVDLVQRPIEIDVNKSYNKIGMYNWGRGIFKYPDEMALDLGDSTFNFIREGDLLLSGQFSWEGAVSIVEKEFNNCISSHRFHIINGHKNKILNEYLWAYFISKRGHWMLEINSFGSGGRNRPLSIKRLLKEKIPIPDMETQNKIRNLVLKYNINFKYLLDRNILLKEYKQSLISETVVGERRVT